MANLEEFANEFFRYVESQNLGDKDPTYVYRYDAAVTESPMDELLAFYLLSLDDALKSKAPPPPTPPNPVLKEDQNGNLILTKDTLSALAKSVERRASQINSGEVEQIAAEALAQISINDLNKIFGRETSGVGISPADLISDPVTGTTNVLFSWNKDASGFIVGTETNDTIIGSSMGGDRMLGGLGADAFILSTPSHTKGNRYYLPDFNPSEGDKLYIASTDTKTLSLFTTGWSLRTVRGKGKKLKRSLAKAKKSTDSFLYAYKNGKLFFNHNLAVGGYGKPEGGLLAKLNPKLGLDILDIVLYENTF